MKTYLISVLLCLFVYLSASAQFTSVTCEKNKTNLKIVQIDFSEHSTLLHFEYDNKNKEFEWMNFNENTYLKVRGQEKKYKLLSSVNMPIANEAEYKQLVFENNWTHHFSLEFELIPDSLPFDMIEMEDKEDAFNVYGITYNPNVKSNFMDIMSFVESYPVKERGWYVQNGLYIQYFKHDGLLISATFYKSNYSKGYQFHFDIKNIRGRSILLNPEKIMVSNISFDKDSSLIKEDLKILSFNEFYKKNKYDVKRPLNSFFYQNNTSFGYEDGYALFYTSSYGNKVLDSNQDYNLVCQQLKSTIMDKMNLKNYSIENRQLPTYIFLNSIKNQEEYAGYLSVESAKPPYLLVSISVDGSTYEFSGNFRPGK